MLAASLGLVQRGTTSVTAAELVAEFDPGQDAAAAVGGGRRPARLSAGAHPVARVAGHVRPVRLRVPAGPDRGLLRRGVSESLSESLLAPNYNMAPTNDIYAVVETPEGRRVEAFHWGLVPVWAKDIKIGQKMINARAETMATKNAFKRPFKRKRCIIPADGFYEWQKRPRRPKGKPAKQPYFIHRLDGEPLAFAGLWETWRDPASGPDAPWLHSCTIVTTTANDDDGADPRPDAGDPAAVGLGRPGSTRPTRTSSSWASLLVPAPEQPAHAAPVSTDVNNVRNQDEHLIDEVDPDGSAWARGSAEPARDVGRRRRQRSDETLRGGRRPAARPGAPRPPTSSSVPA